jgi:DNA polymerase V
MSATKVDLVLPCPPEAADLALPLVSASVAAGFPSPADDYVESQLDLNEHLIRHPAATFFVRAAGKSMLNAGIADGDLLIVDRAIEARDGDIVIAVIFGELTVKRIRRRAGRLLLEPDNAAYPAIDVPPEADLFVWGIVTHSIHRTSRR